MVINVPLSMIATAASRQAEIIAEVYFGVFVFGLWPCFAVWVGYFAPWSGRRSTKDKRALAIKTLVILIAVGVLLWVVKLRDAAAYYLGVSIIFLYVVSLFLSYHIAVAKRSRVPGIWPLAVFAMGGWAFILLLFMREQKAANVPHAQTE